MKRSTELLAPDRLDGESSTDRGVVVAPVASASLTRCSGVMAIVSVRFRPHTIGSSCTPAAPHAAYTSAVAPGSTTTFHSATGVVLPG
ncbi:Uncharacterised protein [Mycobacteroides abscessus subsp. abscessus]|nr:Uncharacterised protein [Mycobacteroides abscessus subsp. abscessus]